MKRREFIAALGGAAVKFNRGARDERSSAK